MKETVHAIAAEEHFAIAEECHAKLAKEAAVERRTALMTVAAQNYFYASINFIEEILARERKLHSFSHENRMRNIIENKEIFSKEVIMLYEKVDRSIRNRVAYRGENGASYRLMKELAQLLAKNGR